MGPKLKYICRYSHVFIYVCVLVGHETIKENLEGEAEIESKGGGQ